MGRGDLTAQEWDRLAPLLPASNGRCGRWRDHRQVVNGILFRVRTGVPWRDLPERFGPWKTVYERHRRWSADGTWDRLAGELRRGGDADPPAGVGGAWELGVDSTICRAHQHAAGAPRQRPRVPGKNQVPLNDAPDEGLGRSRGEFTTKIHLGADGYRRPVSLLITAGQVADSTRFTAVVDRVRMLRSGPGRPRTRPDRVLADKAYSSRANRAYLRGRGITATIPEKSDQKANRLRRGRRGGRPVSFDAEAYKRRNTVERCINLLKQNRAVATRYDKRAYVFHGTVTAAALRLWLRPP
nr:MULTISPECIES: IS5 family transposase [Parafrankia]